MLRAAAMLWAWPLLLVSLILSGERSLNTLLFPEFRAKSSFGGCLDKS